MLDNLREQASSSPFFDDEPDFFDDEEETPEPEISRKPSGPLFGMSSVQRFILSLMLLFTVSFLGLLILLVFQKLWLPIF